MFSIRKRGFLIMANLSIPAISVGQFNQIVEQQIREENYRPIIGLGKGGIGKSESLGDLAKRLDIGYIDLRLLLYTETDLKGIPYPSIDHKKTVWLTNDILPQFDAEHPESSRDPERGILVLDEVTSASKSVRTAAYQLLQERKLNDYVLPEKWLVVCIGNGEDDGGEYNGIEPNFANRCSVYEIVAKFDEWKTWAVAHKVNPMVIAYLNTNNEDFHNFNPDSDTDLVFASPRSWKAVSDILNMNDFNPEDEVLLARMEANVGSGPVVAFKTFMEYRNQMLNTDEILAGKFPKVDVIPNEVLYITLTNLSSKMAEIFDRCQKKGGFDDVALHQIGNAVRWVLDPDRPKEFSAMAVNDLIRSNRDAFTSLLGSQQFKAICPELSNFACTNRNIYR